MRATASLKIQTLIEANEINLDLKEKTRSETENWGKELIVINTSNGWN